MASNQNRIRVLHLLSELNIGGAEVLLLQIIQSLGKTEYEHYVYHFRMDGPIRQKLEALGIPVYEGKKRDSIKRPVKFITSLISHLSDLLTFIRKKDIQIIHAHLGPANQLAVVISKLSSVPAFLTVHSPMAFVDRRSNWDLRLYCQKAVNQFAYRAADRVMVVSQEVKEEVQKRFGIKDTKLVFLKNGIVWDDDTSESVDLQEEFPPSANELKLIAVGRLVPLKNFDMLIRAVKEDVDQGLDDLLLLIAGEGEERMRLEELIRDLGIESYVKLLGLRHDVMGLMQTCDLFVMPSRYEGLSLAMIEAMACGLPIIASDVRGLNDYITNEQNGLLFPVGDYKALAERILQLANNRKLRSKLSQGARESFEKEYDMRKNIRSIDKLFKKYAGKR